jgi:alpha-ribazole phosphatase
MTASALYLVRHGAIVRSAVKTYIGQLDAPLSAEGVAQASVLRETLHPVHFARVISSDLERSTHTARIIAGAYANSIEMRPAFREISLGEWEGCTFRDIQQRFPAEYAARGRDIENWRPSGGESFADCRARVMDALRVILDGTQGNILLVAHAGVNRLILCEALSVPVARLHSIPQEYGCLNIIEFSGTRSTVKLLNFIPPTEPTIAELRLAPALPALLGEEGN